MGQEVEKWFVFNHPSYRSTDTSLGSIRRLSHSNIPRSHNTGCLHNILPAGLVVGVLFCPTAYRHGSHINGFPSHGFAIKLVVDRDVRLHLTPTSLVSFPRTPCQHLDSLGPLISKVRHRHLSILYFASFPHLPAISTVFHIIAIGSGIFRATYRWYISRFGWEDTWAALALVTDTGCLICLWLQRSTPSTSCHHSIHQWSDRQSVHPSKTDMILNFVATVTLTSVPWCASFYVAISLKIQSTIGKHA